MHKGRSAVTPELLEVELCPLYTFAVSYSDKNKINFNKIIFAPRWLPSKREPTWTVGGFGARHSLIKDSLITGAS